MSVLAVLLAVVLLAAAPREAAKPIPAVPQRTPLVGETASGERASRTVSLPLGAPDEDPHARPSVQADPVARRDALAAGAPPSPLYAVALGQGALTTGVAAFVCDNAEVGISDETHTMAGVARSADPTSGVIVSGVAQ